MTGVQTCALPISAFWHAFFMTREERRVTVLPIIEELMESATTKEKVDASNDLRRMFDALWSIAERLAEEENASASPRDKASQFASVETPNDI